MFNKDDYKSVLQSLPEGVEEAEVNAEYHSKLSVSVSENRIVGTEASSLTEVFVRASGRTTGYAYTQSLEEPGLQAILHAFQNSLTSNTGAKDIIGTSEEAYTGCACKESFHETLDDLKSAGIVIEKSIKQEVPEIEDVRVNICATTIGMDTINSRGVDASYMYPVYEAEAKVMSKHNNREYNASCLLTSKTLNKIDEKLIIKELCEKLENQYDVRGFSSGTYPVVLSSKVMINMMTTIWQIFSGVKYVEGSSVLCGKLEQYIGSSHLNISDVPCIDKTGYIYPFDCEGSEGKNVRLVSEGKLTGLLHNLKTSAALKASPTGNAGRRALLSGAISTDITVIPKNIYIEPGKTSVDELLQHMNNGIYITDSYDVFHSINIGSGDFNIPCRGMMIKNGKRQYGVTALNICGNLLDLFADIEEIADDLRLEPIVMLKSYCIGGPSIRLRRLQVNGK